MSFASANHEEVATVNTESTRMLVCGEDLGMIPDCVVWVMNDLRILSLEIQRMPKNPAEEFGNLHHYPYRSVLHHLHPRHVHPSWLVEEDRQQTQRYYNNMLGHYGEAPQTATPEVCEEVVRNHLYSQSIFCIPIVARLVVDGWKLAPDCG